MLLSLGQCFHRDFHAEKCNCSLCHLKMSIYKDERTIEPGCISPDGSATVELTITHQVNIYDGSPRLKCNLFCNHDRCNGPQVGNELKAMIESHHSITALFAMLEFSDGWEHVEEGMTTTTTETTAPKPTTMTTTAKPTATAKMTTTTEVTTKTTNTAAKTTATMNSSVEYLAPIKTLAYFLHLFLGFHLFQSRLSLPPKLIDCDA